MHCWVSGAAGVASWPGACLRVFVCGWVLGVLCENCRVDASIIPVMHAHVCVVCVVGVVFFSFLFFLFGFFVLFVCEGARWMPWCVKPMKDV